MGTTPHSQQAAPCWGEHCLPYASRLRHPLTHLYAKCSQQLGSWACGPGWMQGGLVTSSAQQLSHLPPPQAEPAHRVLLQACVQTGWAEAQTGQCRPYARGKGDTGEKMKAIEREEGNA